MLALGQSRLLNCLLVGRARASQLLQVLLLDGVERVARLARRQLGEPLEPRPRQAKTGALADELLPVSHNFLGLLANCLHLLFRRIDRPAQLHERWIRVLGRQQHRHVLVVGRGRRCLSRL